MIRTVLCHVEGDPTLSVAHTSKGQFFRTQSMNVWSWMLESDGSGIRKCWISPEMTQVLQSHSDTWKCLHFPGLGLLTHCFFRCVPGTSRDFLQDLRRHFAVASVKKRVHGKVLKEPPLLLQSEQLCFAVIRTTFSNNIYLGVKVKASKQICLKILKIGSLSFSLSSFLSFHPSFPLFLIFILNG